LSVKHISLMLQDILKEDEKVSELAELVHTKTGVHWLLPLCSLLPPSSHTTPSTIHPSLFPSSLPFPSLPFPFHFPLTPSLPHSNQGIPFGIILFLKTLYSENLVYFNGVHWEWDTKKIAACCMTGTIVDLVIDKIKLLSPECQEVRGSSFPRLIFLLG
jgi:hypothetical protein